MGRTRQPDQSTTAGAATAGAAIAAPSLAGPAPERERQPGLRAVGIATSRLAAPIIARSGGGILARIKAEWPAIIGPELAAATWPEALGFGGVLKLRVAPAIALDLQHRAPLVVERVNAFFGRQVATRLALVQGPLPFATPPRTPQRAVPAAQQAALDDQVAGIADSELRAALAGLGRAILATRETEG